jgi:hypothetical protein
VTPSFSARPSALSSRNAMSSGAPAEPPKTRTVGTLHSAASSSAASRSRANGRASWIDVSSDTSVTSVRARILRVALSTADGSIGSPSSKRSSSPS